MILHANEANARAATLASDLRLKGLVPIAPAILSGRIAADRLYVVLEADALAKKLECQSNDLNPSLLEIDVAFACRRRGVEMKIIAGERQSLQDPALVRALQNAHRWADLLKAGTGLRTIARQDQYSESYVARILPLATLSPRLQEAIVTGAQPVALTLETLVRTRIPLTWTDQERRFGMHA